MKKILGVNFNEVYRYGWCVLVGCYLILMAGCAALPDMPSLMQQAQGSDKLIPSVRSERLTQEQSRALVMKLQQEGKTSLLERHLAFMQAISTQPLVAGNAVRLLVDGPATYAAMFAAISAAQHHINLETYIFDEQGAGESLVRLLLQKRAQGVQVNILYDSVGSIHTRKEFFQELQEQGINVCEFNPVNPFQGRFFSLNHRDHRKILVVDGHTGFTGGINISSVYSSSSSIRKQRSKNPLPWRDTHIEIRGAAVADLQRLFLDNWAYQRCADLGERNFFPSVKEQGHTLVRTLGSSPRYELNLIYVELLSAILHAERSVHITAAYFIPDQQTVDALKQAARRGVDVALILPSVSDYSITFYAGRAFYSELLQAGVKIYERHGALLHAKTAVIDGVWSTVGSANIDMRSFLYNEEINVVVLGTAFAQQMEQLFEADRAKAARIELSQWERRSGFNKAKEGFARLWAPWL